MMAQIAYSSRDFHHYQYETSAEVASLTSASVKEEIVKQCVRRFYEKHSSVDRYIASKTQFITSSSLNNESEEKLSGLISCGALKEKLKSSETRQILESAGLNGEEISLLLETCNDTSSKSLFDKNKDVCNEENIENLTALKSLLEKLTSKSFSEHNSSPEQFKDVLVFESRREFEAAVRDGVVDRDLCCQRRAEGQSFTGDAFVKLISKKRPAPHPDDPLNHLADLDSELFSKSSKRSRKDAGETTCDVGGASASTCQSEVEICEPELCGQSNASIDNVERPKSMWDVKDLEHDVPLHNSNAGKPSMISEFEKKTDLSKEFVLLPKEDDLLPIPLIREHCAPLDDLMREFPQYSRGLPSRTLYLKNLHKRVTPNNLVSLFGHFDVGPERVTYRLMSGRMKGQAFIKFPNISAATAALEICLGFKLKGKPLVIEYGKHN